MTEITESRKQGVAPRWRRWSGFLLLLATALMLSVWLPPWMGMWVIAGAIFLGLKGLTWPGDVRGLAAYACWWPGFDGARFLQPPNPYLAAPHKQEWAWALGKMGVGVVLLWGGARLMPYPLLAGWVGMAGFICALHFGAFHFVALLWRTRGREVEPLMRNPLAARTLGEFWGSRWNRGFTEAVRREVFTPLRPWLGAEGATMAVFLFSGLIHELAITLPARSFYGFPTAYFLAQGLAALGQRRCRSLACGWAGRVFTLAVVAGPAFWLFPPPWVERVFLPFLHAVHAL